MNKLLFIVMSFGLATAVHAQGGSVLTDNDYAHAESLLNYGTAPLVDHVMGNPGWLAGDKFWYRVLTAKGSEFILVNPAKGTRTAAFDQAKLAAALSTAMGQPIDANRLPFQTIHFSDDNQSIGFQAGGKHWSCSCPGYACSVDSSHKVSSSDAGMGAGRASNQVVSPDGRKAVFIKNYH